MPTSTDAIARIVGDRLTARGLLSTKLSGVEVRHTSEGLVTHFYVAHHEHRGRLAVKIAIDRETAAGMTVDSVAGAVVDAAVDLIGRTLAVS